jgi:hypothetical protein
MLRPRRGNQSGHGWGYRIEKLEAARLGVPGITQSGEGHHAGAAVYGGRDRSAANGVKGSLICSFCLWFCRTFIQRAVACSLDLLLPTILAVSSHPFGIF